ncbi:MAG: class I SAM-dependent methyltransferase [Armatimonadota bacterium]|nr:class I SAM-dependent methyltransferase [Armatimonadota bacterium]MCX7777153.1 class I SAM-dependent methyltransferase [Armatimonadota bacterium]MDW8025201.1 class I SAM-dependent methyltransferase [Armatimonadota bacterium]
MGIGEHEKLERIYSTLHPDEIPWVSDELPEEFVELIESGFVKPCKAIDLGCGLGLHAIHLAKLGFNVTGVDISPSAIERARKNARIAGVVERCRFIVADVLSDLPSIICETFEFAYDWYLLHHIHPEHRERYIANVSALLCSGGKYLSACFSETDAHFGGAGKYRATPLGTVLYFSSEEELRELFSRCFCVLELKTVKVKSKLPMPHDVIIALMEKQ